MERGLRLLYGLEISYCSFAEPGGSGEFIADRPPDSETHSVGTLQNFAARECVISTQLQDSPLKESGWDGTAGQLVLFPTKLRNWLARWRVGISLVGFLSLLSYNVFIRQTIPHNPLQPTNAWVISALGLILTGVAIRSWAAGTLNKSRELTTTGPYALSRNPLYLGSFLMMFGFCLLCKDLPTLIFVAGPLTFLYFGQVEFEEVRLNRMFPDQWPEYRRNTPRLFPRRWSSRAFSGWTLMEWKRNREFRGLMATIIGIAAVTAWYYLRISMEQ